MRKTHKDWCLYAKNAKEGLASLIKKIERRDAANGDVFLSVIKTQLSLLDTDKECSANSTFDDIIQIMSERIGKHKEYLELLKTAKEIEIHFVEATDSPFPEEDLFEILELLQEFEPEFSKFCDDILRYYESSDHESK